MANNNNQTRFMKTTHLKHEENDIKDGYEMMKFCSVDFLLFFKNNSLEKIRNRSSRICPCIYMF
jgi:hypothetical protein